MDAKALLMAAYRYTINEPNIEAGFERFRSIVGGSVDYQAFCDAVASCLRDGLLREPVQLPPGTLQCHWHLELTPKGVEVVRLSLRGGEADEAISVQSCARYTTEVASSASPPRNDSVTDTEYR